MRIEETHLVENDIRTAVLDCCASSWMERIYFGLAIHDFQHVVRSELGFICILHKDRTHSSTHGSKHHAEKRLEHLFTTTKTFIDIVRPIREANHVQYKNDCHAKAICKSTLRALAGFLLRNRLEFVVKATQDYFLSAA